jgi:hypothetical protein
MKFRDTFPDSPVPNKSTISRLVNRFHDTGSVQDRNRSGRPSVLSDDSLDDIRQTLFRSQRKSLRKLSLQSGLSYGRVHKTTKILKLHPYRVHGMHELKESDKEKRLQYCRWFTHFIRGGTDILDKVIFCDEAWFHPSGYVKRQTAEYGVLKTRIPSMKDLHRVASDMRKRVNACIAERGGHFQHLIYVTLFFFFSDFSIIYFLTNRICVRNGLRDFSITMYNRDVERKKKTK